MEGERKNWWPLVFGIALTLYAAFALLDAFVLPSELVTVEEHTRSAAPAEAVTTEDSYESGNISISVSVLTRYDTQVYVADIVLKDPSYLRTALADGSFGRNVSDTTSNIAQENNAILAINGDYYGFRDRGFVMRGGYLYRDSAQKGSDSEDLVIYADGSLEIVNESGSDAAALAEAGAREIFSFGPGLISDGEIMVSADSEVQQAMRSNPRTAIGEIAPLHYLLVVTDGRTEESAGLTLLELAEVMSELGCRTAYNLDGGGSSTMWFMGEVVNNPTSGRRDGERSVSDIVYIGE